MYRLGVVLTLLGAGQTVTVSGGGLVEVIAALLGVFSLAGFVALLRYRKLSGSEKESLITEAAERAVGSMKNALEAAERRIGELEKQVAVLEEKILTLNAQLETANGERAQLQRLLDDALTERRRLEGQLRDLHLKVDVLRDIRENP